MIPIGLYSSKAWWPLAPNFCSWATRKSYNYLMQIFLPFHWPRAHHVTCKYLPTNNGLLMGNVVQLCLVANNILLKPRFSPSCDHSCVKMAAFRKYLSENKLGDWMINNYYWTLYSKIISWFVSVSQINCLPKPNNWSAHHWQNTIFCSTSSSSC